MNQNTQLLDSLCDAVAHAPVSLPLRSHYADMLLEGGRHAEAEANGT